MVLSIETSSTICTVTLSNANEILGTEKIDQENMHGQMLSVLIVNLLGKLDYKINQLDAVAVSSGPGSYTGLRIGMATAKGIAFALDRPLISISTANSLAFECLRLNPTHKGQIMVLLDAGRMEVYNTIFDCNVNLISNTYATEIDNTLVSEINNSHSLVCGNGSIKLFKEYPELKVKQHEPLHFSSEFIARLANYKLSRGEFSDLAYSTPKYVKSPRIGK